MSSEINKNAKRRAARSRANLLASLLSPAPASGPASALVPDTTIRSRKSTPVGHDMPAMAGDGNPPKPKPRPFDSLTRAQLELMITNAKANIQTERAAAAHWKRELDKHDPELSRLALLSGDYAPDPYDFGSFRQRPLVTSYDQALLQDMFRASHREVIKLENKLAAMERKLNEIQSPGP